MNRDETMEYLKEHTIEETCKHFHCTFKQLFSVVENKNVKKKVNSDWKDLKRDDDSKNIYWHRVVGKYYIQKIIDNKSCGFGCYSSLEEAKKVRKDMSMHDWDREYFVSKYRSRRHIYETPYGQFQIKKSIDGRVKHFGNYDTLEEAMEVRDELIMNNWNWSIILKGLMN